MSDKVIETPRDPSIPVVVRRVPLGIDLSHSNDIASLGEVSNHDTLTKLESMAEKFTDEFTQETEEHSKKLDTLTIEKVAKFANTKFPFRSHMSGVSTIAKQLDYCNSHPLEDLREGLDCKMVTVMTGLMIRELSKRSNIKTEIFLISKDSRLHSHPTLLVEIPDNEESENSLIVDFHFVAPTLQMRQQQKFNSTEEEDEWMQKKSKSDFTTRALEDTGKEVFKRKGVTKRPLGLESIQELDQAFLEE